ncbi:MAG: TonB family protein [Gammaproteobacteria bacterium]|nr:TonB family protein [Gammaproteobacteria bacterium]
MPPVTYQGLALSWHPQNSNDKPFAIFLTLILTLFIGLGLFLSTIEVPETSNRTKVEVPERIARFIMEKPKPAPKPPAPKKEIKIKEKPKPEIKPEKPPRPKQPTVKRKKPEKPIKLTKKESTAREKAAKSGLIALSNELSDLIDTSSIDAMMGKPLKKSGKPTQVATVNTALITSDSAQEAKHVDIVANLPHVISHTTLDTQQREAAAQTLLAARAEESVASKKARDSEEQPRAGNQRSEEAIAYVIDQNKSKLHAIYRSARRNNPGIMGMIVLEITILPSGEVEGVTIKSSELNNARLEARLIARIKQFDFGSKNVNKVTVTYPIEFLPS